MGKYTDNTTLLILNQVYYILSAVHLFPFKNNTSKRNGAWQSGLYRARMVRRRVAGRLRCVARHHVEVFEVNNLWLRARRTAAFAQHLPSSFRPPPSSPLTPNQDRSQEAGPSHSAGEISNVVRPPPPAVASYHVVLENSQNRLRKKWLSGRKQDPHVKVLFRKKRDNKVLFRKKTRFPFKTFLSSSDQTQT